MKKQTKIIVAIIAVIFLLAVVFVYKLHWFGAGMKPQLAAATSNPDSAVQAAADTQKVILQAKNSDAKPIADVEFPQQGNTVEDFVTEPYQIAMDAKGLLDNDNLEDVVLVLQNKTDSTDLRPTLVLFKQPAGGYRLYAASWQAIGAEYINGDYQQYDSEDIKIDEQRNLIISTFGSGPVGNRETRYRFIDNELVFTYMETYNVGAGQQTRVEYDILNRKITTEDINTMKENMPSELSYGTMRKHKPYLFKEIDPMTVFTE